MNFSRLAASFFAVVIWFGSALPGIAEKRVALIIGNGNYTSVTPLDNPAADATLMARTLETLNFDVTTVLDATQDELRRAISGFGRQLRASGRDTVGLFYYAGHGVQSFGTNYLLPVDVALTDAADLDLVALEAEAVLRQMRSAQNRTNIVILDACRNNPFETIPSLDDNGLAEMKAPTGTYLAYATGPGSVALDGTDANSPFSAALAVEITREGLAIEEVFKNVRVRVLEQTNNFQTPWDASSLTTNFVFKPAVAPPLGDLEEAQVWASVRASNDPVQLMLFLRSFPDGPFEQAARARLKDLVSEEVEKPGVPEAYAATPPPVDRETEMMEIAQDSGRLEDFLAYLDAFPTGIYSELAKLEVATLSRETATSSAEQLALANTPSETITFETPLRRGASEIQGRSIEELVQLIPLYAPIEGLPDELWKDQPCANCHEWTPSALCTQAKTYMEQTTQRALGKPHPFGGSFKQNLRDWASGGCQ